MIAKKFHRSAFTLIELLIVIAIIALLAAILFPAFMAAREKARAAACQSNMKQIALAFVQYTADYDERLPHAWDSTIGTADAQTLCGYCAYNGIANGASVNDYGPVVWPAKIEPYTKSRQIFSCPSIVINRVTKSPCAVGNNIFSYGWPDGAPVVGFKPGGGAKTISGASQVTYGYNVYYLGGERYVGWAGCLTASTNKLDGTGTALSVIAKPSQTVLIAENGFTNQGVYNMPAFLDFPAIRVNAFNVANTLALYDGDNQCTASGAGGAATYNSVSTPHNDGVNVAFVDGHVKWMRKAALYNGLASVATCDSTNAVHKDSVVDTLCNLN